MGYSIEDYDIDGKYIRALEQAAYIAEIEGIAELTALSSHPVTEFVKEGRVESVYRLVPATSDKYFFKEDIPYLSWTLPMRDEVISHKLGCGVYSSEKGGMLLTACSRDKSDYAKAISKHCWTLGCANCGNAAALRRGAESEARLLAKFDIDSRKGVPAYYPRHYTISPPQEWAVSMMQLPETYDRMYKFIIQILKDYGFHSGAVVFHPWRLNSKKDEERNPSHKEGDWRLGPHFHFIVYGKMDSVSFHNDSSLKGWVIKEVHPGEKIRSVRQTIAYLLTHAGLCSFPSVEFYDVEGVGDLEGGYEEFRVYRSKVNDEEFDVDFDIVDLMDAMDVCEYSVEGYIREQHHATAVDYERLVRNKLKDYFHGFVEWNIDFDIVDLMDAMDDCEESVEGYIREQQHVTKIDFEGLVRKQLKGYFHSVRWFGELGTRNLRILEVYKDKRIRSCPECEAKLMIYRGVNDVTPIPAEYMHKSKIRVAGDDYEDVVELYEGHKDSLEKEGRTVMDFALSVPQCSTPESAGLAVHSPSVSPSERVSRNENVFFFMPDACGGFTPIVVRRDEVDMLKYEMFQAGDPDWDKVWIAKHSGDRIQYMFDKAKQSV